MTFDQSTNPTHYQSVEFRVPIKMVELFETSANGYWNWCCKGLWFPCIAGYGESEQNKYWLRFKHYFCFHSLISIERKRGERCSFMAIVFLISGIVIGLFVLCCITLPVIIFATGSNVNSNQFFGSWLLLALWVYAAMYALPIIGLVEHRFHT